jgi:hypothetical protein
LLIDVDGRPYREPATQRERFTGFEANPSETCPSRTDCAEAELFSRRGLVN